MKYYALQFITPILVFFRYDLLRYCNKIRRYYQKRPNRFRGQVAKQHWNALWDAQHEFNQLKLSYEKNSNLTFIRIPIRWMQFTKRRN